MRAKGLEGEFALDFCASCKNGHILVISKGQEGRSQASATSEEFAPMDRVTSMKLFHATVLTGSFSDAGRQHGLAPSSVSRQISALEDRLEVQLFNRSTRQLHLTEAGEIYHNKVAEILQMIDDAEEAVNELQDKPRGTLNLNVPIAFGRRKVAPLLPKFMAQYPEIEIELTMTDTVINVIEEGADVAIRVGELTDSSLIARKLAPNRRVVAAAPEYLAKHGTPETPDDLRAEHHRFLSYRRQHRDDIWHFQGQDGAEWHLKIHAHLHANSGEGLLPAARAGAGIVLLPTYLVGLDIQRGRLQSILPDYKASPTALDTDIFAIYPPNRHLSPKVRALVDFLVKEYGNPPYWDDPSVGPDPFMSE